MRPKSARAAFPLGLFLASTCVMAVIICLGACIAIGRGAGLSYPAYAVFPPPAGEASSRKTA